MQKLRIRVRDANSIYSRNLNPLGNPHDYDLQVESIKHWRGWWNCSDADGNVITSFVNPQALLQVSYHTFTYGNNVRFGAIVSKTDGRGFKNEIKVFKDTPRGGWFDFNVTCINLAREEMKKTTDAEYRACINRYIDHAMARLSKLRR